MVDSIVQSSKDLTDFMPTYSITFETGELKFPNIIVELFFLEVPSVFVSYSMKCYYYM